MPATILIAGATGVVGRNALHQLLASTDVSRVIAIGRRNLPDENQKLTSRVADLGNPQSLLVQVPDGITVAISALGTTMKQAGSKEAFRAVDHDAVLNFANAALVRGARRFLLVSSVGANPNSSNFYLRTKGETEADLERLAFANLTILRPSFIDDQGTRPDHRLGERLALPAMRAVFSIAGKHSRYAPITADALGRALTRLAFDDAAERVRVLEGRPLFDAGQ